MPTKPALKPKRPYFGGGRKSTGVLIRGSTGYSARFWAVVDGERVRITKPLGTENKQVAARKMARLLADSDPTSVDAAAPETFLQAAERVCEARKAAGIKSAKDELARLKLHAITEVGLRPVTSIQTKHVNAVLDAVAAAGRSKQSCQHVKQAIANVFAVLKREGVIAINPCDDAELPTYARTLQKTRAVLTVQELLVYLRWHHPEPRHAMGVRERQTMSCVAYCFGGLRTGDLHALKWRHLNPPTFVWGIAPRQKTAKPQAIKIPDVLRPVLLEWYESHPKQHAPEDPVFPTRRAGKTGSTAGSTKGKVSHAHAFRRDLRRAFGLEVWNATAEEWQPAKRPPTHRERELLDGTEEIEPVDFHSWRRGFRQALDGAKVDAATARALGGWDSNQDASYNVNPDHMVEIPAVALPSALPMTALPPKPGRKQKTKASSIASSR